MMVGFEALKLGGCNMLQSRLSGVYACECLRVLVRVMREALKGGAGRHGPSPPYIHNLIHFVGEMDVYQLARQLQRL